MRRILAVGLAVGFTMCAPRPSFAQTNHAPRAVDVTATSLARARPDWTVITTFTLGVADDDSTEWTFSLVQPASLTEGGKLRVTCIDPVDPDIDLGKKVKQTTLVCRYQPAVGFTGDETFQY